MGPFELGWLMGAITGGFAGVLGLLTYQWLRERARWRRRTEVEPYIERLRALDRPLPKKPSPIVSDRHPSRRIR